MPLGELIRDAARVAPRSVAIEEVGGGSIRYGDLDDLSDRVRDALLGAGIDRGDRVAVQLPKSIDAVATILGILKSGAAYVPIDPEAPPARAALVVRDADARVLFGRREAADAVAREVGEGAPVVVALETVGGGHGIEAAVHGSPPAPEARLAGGDDLAYVLYTSGSTGRPKGVAVSHAAAASFVEWASTTFAPKESDRFGSHAPLHFDLSIFDLFVAIRHRATVVLFGEAPGRNVPLLAEEISRRRISIWYSAPSVLAMLAAWGRLERHSYADLRTVLFAGEVFPVAALRALTERIPNARYFNLYGPTETNVCTFHEIPLPVPADRVRPYPIGRPCAHARLRVLDDQGRELPPGAEGELCVAGPSLMRGYWNAAEATRAAFSVDERGVRWYRTGDRVTIARDGECTFHGRLDRMVKRKGVRIELGDVEAALAALPGVAEAAVVAVADEESGVTLEAFVASTEAKPSEIAIRRELLGRLPRSMLPDRFVFLSALPRTSTGKIDYVRLGGRA